MSLAPITLTTDKSTAVIDNAHRRLRQDESGLSITVTVLNEDNVAYDLTGKSLVFCENKQNNKIIVDNGKGDNAGKFNRNSDNDTKGVFTYVLQEDVYTAPGKAWFEITDGTTVDSTKNFYFDVEKDADISFSNNDYIGSLKALETAMAGAEGKITSDLADMEAQIIKKIADGQSLIKNAESSTQSSIDSLNGKINQAISNGQQDIANSLAETKAANDGKIIQALKDLTNQTTAALSNVDEYTKKLATLQSQWDSELQNIKNKANTDTDSAVKAINDKYTNDFNKIKSDFANWQTSTTQNYQKQVDDILTQVQKSGTEVADVQKQVNDTIAKVQDLTKQFSKVDFTQYAHKDEVNALNWKTVDKVNADTITYTSKLFLTNPSNVPNNTWGYLITNRGIDSPNRVTQEWWSDNGDTGQTAPHYYRQITYDNSQKWSPWLAQATQNDVDSINNKISKLGSVKTVDKIQPDNSGNVQTDHYTKAEVDSKTSGTVVTAYDIASKKPTTETNSYTSGKLVDQGALGQFADQINQLKGRRVANAVDCNTLTDSGIYCVTNPFLGKNFPTTDWGTLTVFNGLGDGHTRTTQIFVDDNGTSAFLRISDDTTWKKWNQLAWTSDITSLSDLINANQSQIAQAQKDITALQKAKPDLSGYETTTAVKTLADRITALENKKPIRAWSQNDAVAKSQSSNDEYYW